MITPLRPPFQKVSVLYDCTAIYYDRSNRGQVIEVEVTCRTNDEFFLVGICNEDYSIVEEPTDQKRQLQIPAQAIVAIDFFCAERTMVAV
jgi:hypothetical protein